MLIACCFCSHLPKERTYSHLRCRVQDMPLSSKGQKNSKWNPPSGLNYNGLSSGLPLQIDIKEKSSAKTFYCRLSMASFWTVPLCLLYPSNKSKLPFWITSRNREAPGIKLYRSKVLKIFKSLLIRGAAKLDLLWFPNGYLIEAFLFTSFMFNTIKIRLWDAYPSCASLPKDLTLNSP